MRGPVSSDWVLANWWLSIHAFVDERVNQIAALGAMQVCVKSQYHVVWFETHMTEESIEHANCGNGAARQRAHSWRGGWAAQALLGSTALRWGLL